MKISITTNVENGNLKRNRNQIKEAIESFEGKVITITLERSRRKRSNSQNSYYHGIVVSLVQEGLKDATGELRSRESIHYNILLPMFAPVREIVNIETGEFISEKITSSEMTTTEFSEYIMEIQKWAAEFLGIDIPSPNEELEINFNQ